MRERLRSATQRGDEERVAALEEQIAWAKGQSPEPKRFAATAMVLRDLLQLGWELQWRGEEAFVRPHDASDGLATKEAVRRQLHFGRADQLRDPRIRQFILGLESPRHGATHRSILSLIADGPALAARLRPVAALPRAERADALRAICRPYLHLVEQGKRDPHTNLLLSDVWRYFRYTWSSRYRRTPGRVMFYLVRDGAQPDHPVMGLVALSNTVLQLSSRDEWLGWTTSGLLARIDAGELSEQEAIDAVRRRIDADLGALYTEDFGFDGARPPPLTSELRGLLRAALSQATKDRAAGLREGKASAEPGSPEQMTQDALSAAARTPLFRAKRAAAALVLLETRDVLASVGSKLRESLSEPAVVRAVDLALRQGKQWYAAGSVMEISTCGAVPPYGHILGGKLAGLLMLSPSVRRTYRERYRDEPSVIASQMAGRRVAKDAELVLLGTTSLYQERSSQYNRLKIPAGVVGPHPVEFLEIGRSKGHGASNLSTETEGYLALVAREQRTFDNVNFVFGEGQSPKMRQTREGLAALGLGAADLIHHASPRLIYIAPLIPNVRRVLLGLDEAVAAGGDAESDERVSEFWRARWLSNRLDHAPALDALEKSPRQGSAVSRLLLGDTGGVQLSLFEAG